MLEIDHENYISENILSRDKLIFKLEELKKECKKIGLCTGSFDLLHPGHITHFISAKKKCDILIVSIARDHFSSNKNPGSGRPIFTHNLRAFIVSNLKPVDFVTFDDGNVDILERIKPHVYIKGSDYIKEKNESIITAEKIMESLKGKTYYTEDEKLSTSDIIKHIKENII